MVIDHYQIAVFFFFAEQAPFTRSSSTTTRSSHTTTAAAHSTSTAKKVKNWLKDVEDGHRQDNKVGR